jgi:hypothetical protein
MTHGQRALLLCSSLALLSCGRIGYEPVSGDDDSGTGSDIIDASPLPDALPDSTLLVWITMSGNPATGVIDRQGLLAPGSCVTGRCPMSVAGQIGTALRFDGVDDYLEFATNDALDFGQGSQPFTVSLWYRAADLTPPAQQVLMAQSTAGGGVSYQLSFEAWQGGNALDLVWKVCESDCQSALFAVSPDHTDLDEWIFIAGTWDGSVTRLYVNAEEIAAVPKSLIAFDGGALMIGADLEVGPSIEDSFNGAIDDFRIYSRALSAADQMTMMQAAGI